MHVICMCMIYNNIEYKFDKGVTLGLVGDRVIYLQKAIFGIKYQSFSVQYKYILYSIMYNMSTKYIYMFTYIIPCSFAGAILHSA